MRLPDGSGVPVACAVPVVPTVPAAGQSVSFRRFRLLVPFPVLPAFPVLSCPSCTFRSSRPLLSLSRCFGRRTIPPVSAVCRPCPPPCCPSPGASTVRILLVVSDSPGCPDHFGCFVPPFIWTVAFRDRNRACLVRPCRALSGRCPAIRRYFCRARPCTVNPVQKRSCGVRTSDFRGPANRPSPPSGGDRKKFS